MSGSSVLISYVTIECAHLIRHDRVWSSHTSRSNVVITYVTIECVHHIRHDRVWSSLTSRSCVVITYVTIEAELHLDSCDDHSRSCLAWLSSIIGGSCHECHFCRDKSFVETKHVFCHEKSMLVATKRLSRQTRVCRYKHNFVATNITLVRLAYFCRDKNDTCGSSRQWYSRASATVADGGQCQEDYIILHVKDPVAHVRVRRIMETLK